MAYQSPFAPAPEKQATGGYVSPFQKSKPAKAAPAPAPVSSPVVPKPSSTVSLRATGPRKNLVPKAVTTLPDQGQTLSAPTTPLPKVPIKEAIVQSGKDALAVKPVQREKSGQSLIEQTYLSTVSQGANALKFAVEKVAKEPTVLLGPLHYVPGVSKLNEPARKKVDQLNAEGKNPFASVASEAELRRASFTTDSPEYQKASLTEKITKYLPETLYNLVPDVAGSAVPYLINPSLGFAVAAGSTAEDVKQKAVENGVPEKEAEAIGITTGLAVGALDRIVPDEIFGGSATTKTLFSKGFFTRLAQMTKTGLKEAATEVAQEDIQLAAEATFRDDLGWDEIKTRNVMAGLGGLFGGAGMKAVGEIAMQTPDVVYGQEAQAGEVPSPTPPTTPPSGGTSGYISPFANSEEIKPAETAAVGEGYSQGSKKLAEVFNQSSGQRSLGKIHGRTFEVGSFGENHLLRKLSEGKPDRITLEQAIADLPKATAAYRASDNPQSYRYDNVAWIKENPDGTGTAIYTRKNKNGAEEIIAFHELNKTEKANYVEKLASYGTPSRDRTGTLDLEDRGSIQLSKGGKETLPQNTISGQFNKKNPQAVITLRDTPLHNRIMSELIFSEKGERIAVRKDDASGFTWSAKRSTFPSWVPADLRRKPLFDAVASHIQNGTVPTKAAELRLYKVVAEEMEAQNEVLHDEKYIASLREDVIVPFATDEENSLALAKFDEQYGKLKASQDGSPAPGGGTDERVGAAIQAETKSTEVAAEKAKPVRSTKAESRVLERLRQELPELGEGIEYTVQSLKENTAKAVQLVEDDKTKAYRIAMGVESAPENQTQTAVSIALAEKALEDGNLELYGQLTRQRTLEQTRRGQEIVAEKGSVTDNSTSRYVKELVRQRLAKYDAGYLGALKAKMLRKVKGSKAIATIDEEVGKIKERIKNTKELDLDEAQKFLDSLACK